MVPSFSEHGQHDILSSMIFPIINDQDITIKYTSAVLKPSCNLAMLFMKISGTNTNNDYTHKFGDVVFQVSRFQDVIFHI